MKASAYVRAVLCFFLLFVTSIILSGAGWNPTGLQWNFTNSAQFGDSFGFLSSIMATAAAWAAFSAYGLQREEIDRLKSSEDSERRSASKRDFEQTYFNLLSLFRDTVNEINFVAWRSGDKKSGRDALSEILHSIFNRASLKKDNFPDEASLDHAFKSTYNSYRDDLAHYFRLFYHILRFVDDVSFDEKRLYVRLLRATLSDTEMILIGLNCIYGDGIEKLTPLLTKYEMLHNISEESISRWSLDKQMPMECFGDRSLI